MVVINTTDSLAVLCVNLAPQCTISNTSVQQIAHRREIHVLAEHQTHRVLLVGSPLQQPQSRTWSVACTMSLDAREAQGSRPLLHDVGY